MMFFFFKQKTAYEMRISDWSSDVCSSDLAESDDIIERIVGSQRLDVLELVEDEIILGLPYVPMHDVCPSLPESLSQEPDTDPARPSPFAALSQLKKD